MAKRTIHWRWAPVLALALLAGGGAAAQQTPPAAPAAASSAQEPQAPVRAPNVVAAIICHGNHTLKCPALQSRIFTQVGQVFDSAQINRDENSLWNTGYFDDVTIATEQTPNGINVHIYVKEKPLVRDIKYDGLKSITESDILDRYKARNVHLDRESRFDPVQEKHAELAIKELLAEHGRQYATVKVDLQPSPPSSMNIVFNVDEGPKVLVGNVTFSGNHVLPSRTLYDSMIALHPVGLPHSLILENLFPKTYDVAALNEDMDHVRAAYQDRGYYDAAVEDPDLKLRNTRSRRILFWGGGEGKRVDIHIPIVEGVRYKVGAITFHNNKEFTNTAQLSAALGLHTGEVLDVSKLRKGMENLKKLYGIYGFINFVPTPQIEVHSDQQVVNITMEMEEGKPFYVRRIEFTGNTTTRDKVIRRELLLSEGSLFRSDLWENSLLRLNQLGYFDNLRPEDATVVQDETGPEGHVDLTLHVKEKGKNTIGMSGGVNQLTGSFVGLNYSTNNLFGLGETLSISTQYGELNRNATFSFVEPYLYNRPLQLNFSVYTNNFHYDQAKEASLIGGQNLEPYFAALGANNILNYAQASQGFTVGMSYPRKGKFTRLGLTYGYDTSQLQPFTQAASVLFNSISYQGLAGPSSLNGIHTSQVIPSLTINTLNSVYNPTQGKSVEISSEFAGIGGNVRLVKPSITASYFHKAWKNNVIGMRFLGSYVTGWGGETPPTFQRLFTGGENTIRGFDIMAVTPIALIPSETTVPLEDPNNPGQPFTKVVPNPTPASPSGTAQITFPINIPQYTITTPGGDTMAIGNFEYRIPVGKANSPVEVAYFVDTGIDMITNNGALKVNQTTLGALQTAFDRPFQQQIQIAAHTNSQVRLSTGVELSVLMPVIHAPVRIYYAENPLRVNTFISPPQLYTLADFEKSIPAAYQSDADVQQAVRFTLHQLQTAPGLHFQEAPHVIRLTISRTF